MTTRIKEASCPECGAYIWKLDERNEAVAAQSRIYKTCREQAIEILELKLKVASLEEWRRDKEGKVQRQGREINRLRREVDRLRDELILANRA